MENDEEGTSEGNTTQETYDTEEKVLQINQNATKNFTYMQSSSTDQHTSVSFLCTFSPALEEIDSIVVKS